MIFPMPSFFVLLLINAFAGALFIFAAYEAYQLSKPDLEAGVGWRPPWAEKLILVVTALSQIFLVSIALILAYRHFYGA